MCCLGLMRVAHCITGVASHARADPRDGFTMLPITDPRQQANLTRWRDDLQRFHNVSSHFFLVLDLGSWKARTDDLRTVTQVQQGVGSSEWRASHTASNETLRDIIENLQPVATEVYDALPFCKTHAYECSCAAMTAHGAAHVGSGTDTLWFEQVAKHARCLRLVEQEERRRGYRYDAITKIRSDFPIAALWSLASPQLVADVAREKTENVWLSPWKHGRGRWGCYRESDWMVLASREAAATYLNFSSAASCEWLKCFRQRHLNNPGFRKSLMSTIGANLCVGGERMLVDYLLWHHLSVRALAPRGSSPGAEAGSKRLDSTYALMSGVITEESTWHTSAFEHANISFLHPRCQEMLLERSAVRVRPRVH